MTDNQKRFCEEYLKDCNATRAYKAAYPNVKSSDVASAAGTRLLGNVKVKAYIDEQLEKISSEKIADAKEVMEYLTSVLRGKTQSSVLSLCGDGCQEVIEKAPDEKERLKAAELLGKRYALFKESVNIDGEQVIIVNDLKE